ncbi:hypothetical protein PVL29_022870 [Vitis rotundifolia]|uniref:Cyclin N-terminal domain-containing protein n=1 Tax=Vitis rotundifolia TaxID=103349 RepID=A0AA38YWQ5_VITRO|nr:hypothetical protein PVL29_022870 [Vitis rotundifolia]
MASRPIILQHHQPRGEALVGNGKQRKNGAAEGRNRQAPRDIGNIVTIRGVDGKPYAVAKNNKKAVCVNVDGAPIITDGEAIGKAPVAAKAVAQKKVTIKPKPEQVIEIIPDSEEVKQEKPMNTKKAREGSSKKNVQTMTSILTTRSNVACGLTNKSNEQIVDIDAADASNDLAGVEYVEDIYKFYKLIESESQVHDYMDSQAEINEKMRAILVDWLIETLYLTINIVDHFLSIKTVSRRKLQLVGKLAMVVDIVLNPDKPNSINFVNIMTHMICFVLIIVH